MIYYLAPVAFTPKSGRLAELSSLHAGVVTLPSIPGCDEKRVKDTLVVVFPSAFSRPLVLDSAVVASTFPEAMRSHLMSLS